MIACLPRSHFLLLHCAILVALARSPLIAREKPDLPRKDPRGDPLPQGAVARLGTVRFHNPEPIHTVAFAPDGQSLLVFAHHYPNSAVRLWNIADGKELARFDLCTFRENLSPYYGP